MALAGAIATLFDTCYNFQLFCYLIEACLYVWHGLDYFEQNTINSKIKPFGIPIPQLFIFHVRYCGVSYDLIVEIDLNLVVISIKG